MREVRVREGEKMENMERKAEGEWQVKEVKMEVRRFDKKYLQVKLGGKKWIMQEVKGFWGEEEEKGNVGF